MQIIVTNFYDDSFDADFRVKIAPRKAKMMTIKAITSR